MKHIDKTQVGLDPSSTKRASRFGLVLTLFLGIFASASNAQADPDRSDPASGQTIRVALFNIWELSTDKIMNVDANGLGIDPQARAAAEILQKVRPDVLVINEIDHDYENLGTDGSDYALNARRFTDNYLATGASPLSYPFAWAAPNNTGILSGIDLNGDGYVATEADIGTQPHGNDSFGYGEYPGQFSMAVLSKYPIDEASVRTFRELLWRDMPGNHIPKGFYSDEALAHFRLSSKSHQDVPILVDGRRIHLFLSHPTPIVFDAEEDRNGRRNWDEIRLWVDYLANADWMVDDQGQRGGYSKDEAFIIAGDLNARPDGTESIYEGAPAIRQLLEHPRLQDPEVLVSEGAPAGQPSATAAFRGKGARIDYLLPSVELKIVDGAVFWPSAATDPEGARQIEAASDHRLVWLDLQLPTH
jgi:hypothetical protein